MHETQSMLLLWKFFLAHRIDIIPSHFSVKKHFLAFFLLLYTFFLKHQLLNWECLVPQYDFVFKFTRNEYGMWQKLCLSNTPPFIWMWISSHSLIFSSIPFWYKRCLSALCLASSLFIYNEKKTDWEKWLDWNCSASNESFRVGAKYRKPNWIVQPTSFGFATFCCLCRSSTTQNCLHSIPYNWISDWIINKCRRVHKTTSLPSQSRTSRVLLMWFSYEINAT